ncbi:2-hydroxycarboxylate transporter family protein, partial [Escherichia coli]|uniref:2-hydroxycarboxylate transporter family protein n=1 Tax=Escherichia coli TaxID=562 RepID=UPI0039E0A1DA
MEWRVGIVPVPVGLLLLVCVATFVALGKVPTDITMMIPVLAAGGFACAEIGKRLPVLRRIG